MKRFYKAATAQDIGAGWTVHLDGKPIRTPAKASFLAPQAVAQAAAAEWDAQVGAVKPAEMPITRAVNSAIDRTGPEFDAVVEMVAAYGGSDLICYRAERPDELVRRQLEAWTPMISWVDKRFGAQLVTAIGVMHRPQPSDGQKKLTEAVAQYDPLSLTALYDLVALSGSLIIGLAVAEARLSVADGWATSRIDETWQSEQWGVDDDAAALAARKKGEFEAAARLLAML
jgi:chaperone required for assembly of F1-ATPase